MKHFVWRAGHLIDERDPWKTVGWLTQDNRTKVFMFFYTTQGVIDTTCTDRKDAQRVALAIHLLTNEEATS